MISAAVGTGRAPSPRGESCGELGVGRSEVRVTSLSVGASVSRTRVALYVFKYV